jgi:hypothetical protein
MRFYLKLLVLLIGFTLFSPLTALAQQNCGELTKMRTQLEKQYKEKLVVMGVTSKGELLTIFATRDGSTWTFILNYPNGKSCILGVGENLRVLNDVYGDLI